MQRLPPTLEVTSVRSLVQAHILCLLFCDYLETVTLIKARPPDFDLAKENALWSGHWLYVTGQQEVMNHAKARPIGQESRGSWCETRTATEMPCNEDVSLNKTPLKTQ
ncbi:hypothetical protein PoB_006123700 [Plakobranchus ocellatus]|uniref:Uncharacterized protein n=1 Tax=Plakobranchus ocellatus TaxID=259542 RepID=A0AAV4CS65_9GAST|nr:hypothetical protein PoB_006123700 [Plakobranchus ocellatus]